MNPKKIILFADGGARGNPGPAGAGAYLTDESGQELARLHHYLGEATNNVAEYTALILGLQKAQELGGSELLIQLDSQLIVRQIEGEYRVKQPHLIPLYQKAQGLLRQFQDFEIRHIPREENSQADLLANQAIDEGLGLA